MMIALKSGLQKFLFLFLIEKRYLQDFITILALAKKYANAEEAYKLHGTVAREVTKGKEEKPL